MSEGYVVQKTFFKKIVFIPCSCQTGNLIHTHMNKKTFLYENVDKITTKSSYDKN